MRLHRLILLIKVYKIMLDFLPLDDKALMLKDYFEKSEISFCDLSVGVRYMWRDDYKVDYAIYKDVLYLKETTKDYKDFFYFPISLNGQTSGLNELEKYCKETGTPLNFCCIDNLTVAHLSSLYPYIEVYNDRDWNDYIYDAEKFKTFSGKKYGGQRNHVNKFKKTYPNYTVKVLEESDNESIFSMLEKFDKEQDFSLWSAESERKKIKEFIINAKTLGQSGIVVYVDGQVVGFSIGERVKDTLIVHVEKGLKEYEGVYPFIASEFVKAFWTSEIKYLNREEDCGDNGLRISKLQYRPIEIKQKNFVKVKKLSDEFLMPNQKIDNELSVSEILAKDKKIYAKIYLDEQLNAMWGYDFRQDLGKAKPTPDYFFEFQKSLKDKKEEFSLALRLNGKMIGELVYHNFDLYGGVEIGFRVRKEFQNKGYAYRGVKFLVEYAFDTLKAKKVKAKCYLNNTPSMNLLKKVRFSMASQDQTYYYFELIK